MLVELSVVEQRYHAVMEVTAGVPVTQVGARDSYLSTEECTEPPRHPTPPRGRPDAGRCPSVGGGALIACSVATSPATISTTASPGFDTSTASMSPMPYEAGLARLELRRRPQFTQPCCRVRAGQLHQGSGTHTQQPGGQRLSDVSPTTAYDRARTSFAWLTTARPAWSRSHWVRRTRCWRRARNRPTSPTPLAGLHGGPGSHPDQG